MTVEEKNDLENFVHELQQEKLNLEKDINQLNLVKIQKLETINEELEKDLTGWTKRE